MDNQREAVLAKLLINERALTDAFAHATAFLFTHGDESELDAVLARYRNTRQRHGDWCQCAACFALDEAADQETRQR